MPAAINAGGAIAHLANMNNGQRGDAINVIHKLTYGDIWRAPRTLQVENQMRLDMQGTIAAAAPAPAFQNLQVQIGGNSVAHANVAHTLTTDNGPNQLGVLRKVKTALRQSLATGLSHTVTGSIP